MISSQSVNEIAGTPASPSGARKRRRGRDWWARHATPYLLLAPTAIVLAVFLVYPLINTVLISFWEYPLVQPNKREFVGLEKYVDLFDDSRFWKSLEFTLKFTTVSIGLSFALGLTGALALEQVRRGRSVLAAMVFLPYMVAPIATGLIWRLLWSHDFGLINYMLSWGDLGPVVWLGDTEPAFWAVIVSDVWRTTPFVMLILLAGLTSIPTDLIEAARIDGASPLQLFTAVILPLLSSAITVALIFQTIFKLRVFDIVFSLTGGGPGRATTPLGLMIHQTYFRYFEAGEASAIAVVLLVLGTSVSLVYIRFVYREIEY